MKLLAMHITERFVIALLDSKHAVLVKLSLQKSK
jgi:hypothetical protein